MRLVKKLALGCGLMALGFLANVAQAKDYKLFSLDFDDNWVEMMPEQGDQTGAYMVNLMNNKDQVMLMITTKKMDAELNAEQFQIAAKTMVELMKQRGMSVSKQGYDDDDEIYYAQGTIKKMPYKMHIFVKDGVLFDVISAGNDIEAGLDMIDEIEVK